MHFTLAAAFLVSMFVAQQPAASSDLALSRMTGQWTGSGVVNGAPVQARAEFGPVLAKKFTRLSYVFSDARAGDVFEGHAYYTCAAGSTACSGNWFDSQGSSHVLKAVHANDTLTAEWGDGVTPRGKTEYRLVSADTLVVTDWVRTATGEWRQFGKVDYKRK